MSLDAQILRLIINKPERMAEVQALGLSAGDLVEPYSRIWTYLIRMKRQHGEVPSLSLVQGRFPDLHWPPVRTQDLPQTVHGLLARKRMNDFIDLISEASRTLNDPEDVPDVIQRLQGGLNRLQMSNGTNHMVDAFSGENAARLVEAVRQYRRPRGVGMPTGLTSFDNICGGLQAKRMVVIIGRTGSGKSWLDLFFVAEAVRQGRKVILYPLEMSVEETCLRLYTIFSQKLFRGGKTLKNLDLSRGRVNKRRFLQLLSVLEDRYNGQLLVADVGALSDPYTIERMEAEVELHQPDMFWVDYLTLLKAPQGMTSEDWQAVRMLSGGIQGIGMRHNCVGGCSAQVNRESIKSRFMLPRLEHISFGDSIGHDAHQVFSIAKRKEKLHWALVKNRSGPELGGPSGIVAEFDVDQGILRELPQEGEEESDNQADTGATV